VGLSADFHVAIRKMAADGKADGSRQDCFHGFDLEGSWIDKETWDARATGADPAANGGNITYGGCETKSKNNVDLAPGFKAGQEENSDSFRAHSPSAFRLSDSIGSLALLCTRVYCWLTMPKGDR